MTINSLSLRLLENHPQDAARTLEKCETGELVAYLENIPLESRARLIRHLIPAVAVDCLCAMTPDTAAAILEEFSVERASVLLRRINVGDRNRIIRSLTPIFSNMVKLVLRYPEGTVGQLMTPRVFAVHEDINSEDVLQMVTGMSGQLQKHIYVINDDQHLVGVIDIRDLLTEKPVSAISKIMQPPGTSLSARSSISGVQHAREWKYAEMLPVVDHAGTFIGVLKRGVMLDALAHDISERQEDFTGTALAIAEIFWDACANMLVPEIDNTDKGHKDER